MLKGSGSVESGGSVTLDFCDSGASFFVESLSQNAVGKEM